MADPITASIPRFAKEIAHISESATWALVSRGELETIAIGRRRLVVVESYRQLIAKKLAEPPQDARRNQAVPPLGGKRGHSVSPTASDPEQPKRKRGRPPKTSSNGEAR